MQPNTGEVMEGLWGLGSVHEDTAPCGDVFTDLHVPNLYLLEGLHSLILTAMHCQGYLIVKLPFFPH